MLFLRPSNRTASMPRRIGVNGPSKANDKAEALTVK